MYVNLTGRSFYLDKDGQLTDEPAKRATLLLAPDGQLADDLVRKHGLEDVLTDGTDVVYVNEATGEEYVHRDGRAIAAHLVTEPPVNRTVLKPRTIISEEATEARKAILGSENKGGDPTVDAAMRLERTLTPVARGGRVRAPRTTPTPPDPAVVPVDASKPAGEPPAGAGTETHTLDQS